MRLRDFIFGCDGGVRKTYVGPTGHCWGSGSWGTAPGVYPDDSALYGYSSPDGKLKELNIRINVRVQHLHDEEQVERRFPTF